MAARLPLVIVNGEIQQLQPGDNISEVDFSSMTNGESSAAMAVGDAVYLSATGEVKKGKANALATAEIFGFSRETPAAGAAGFYQTEGVMPGFAGLTPTATYYLSPTTFGLITVTAPTAVGQVVTRVGKAVSATELDIKIQRAVLL